MIAKRCSAPIAQLDRAADYELIPLSFLTPSILFNYLNYSNSLFGRFSS